MNPTPRVDLHVVPLGELIIRAGDLSLPTAKKVLVDGYEPDSHHPDVHGLSVVFHQGASLDALARTAHFPHRKISYSVVSRVQHELVTVGYEMVLFITPSARNLDHHTLAVAQNGLIEQKLPDTAADALLRAFMVVDNPYRQP